MTDASVISPASIRSPRKLTLRGMTGVFLVAPALVIIGIWKDFPFWPLMPV